MGDDTNKKSSFSGGFLRDALKDLQTEYSNETASKNKKKSRKAGADSNPANIKRIKITELPAETALPSEAPLPSETTLPAETAMQSETPLPAETALASGQRSDYHPGDMLLDTYRVESEAIHGGMGAVWRVNHTGWNMDLAMKRPKAAAFQTPEQKKNFAEECRHWINLGLHPNIVSCYYVREVGSVPTVFSEWMENGSLENHIKKGTLYSGTEETVQERLLDIAVQFARGLHYAHLNHLIHQDVKPDNVLLANDWTAKVSDFGLARARTMMTLPEGEAAGPAYDSDRTVVTPSGGKTPAYCSPEQAASQLLTSRTDIYSWGVSIMEMYLGSKPWAHSGQLTGPLAGIACRAYFDMCTEHPIPAALQTLLEQCMQQDPELRPDDFSVVETELLKIYQSVTGLSYPRPEPKAAPDTPDSLNNKALSYLDLGLSEEAMNCWKMANDKDPLHSATVYNSVLQMWRSGEVDDLNVIRLVHSDLIDRDHKYLAARIELERGNGEFEKTGADECDLKEAELLPALDRQTYALKNLFLFEKPCLEISPDEKLFLAGGQGAALFSLKDKKAVWTNLNMNLDKGSAVNWEKGEICSTRRPDDETGLQGMNAEHTLYFYRLNNGRMKEKIEINDHPEACAYKNDRQIYVTSSHMYRNQYNMSLLDLSTKEPLKERTLHQRDFTFGENIDVMFRPDGSCVLAYWKPARKGEIICYDADNLDPVNRVFLDRNIDSLHSDEKEDRIWCLSREVYSCDFKTGNIQRRYKDRALISDFNICGDTIVAATNNNYLKFIDSATGRVLRSISIPGTCHSGTLKIGKNRVYCLLSKDADHPDELFTAVIPKFGYKAPWELSKIQTSSWRIELERRFSRLISEAEEAVRKNNLKKADLLIEQAIGLDPGMQNDSRARSLLHKIQSRKIKNKLNRAVLVRAVGSNASELSFSEDSKELLIIEKNNTGTIVNVDTGEMLYGLDKTRCLPSAKLNIWKKREAAASMLPIRYGKVRLAFDTSEDEKNAAAIDIKSMGSPPKCTLRLISKETGSKEWSTDLDLFYTTDDTLHFLSDGKTLLMTRRMAHIFSKNLIIRFSFWNVPEHRLLKEFDITGGPIVNHFKFSVSPDEKAALVEYQIPDGPGDPYNERPAYEYCLVDFQTGWKTKALQEEPKKLKTHYGIKKSNKLRFTGVDRQIMYIKDPYTVALTPLHPGEREIEAVNDFQIPEDIAVSPDGLFLAVAGGETKNIVCIYRLEWDLQYPEE